MPNLRGALIVILSMASASVLAQAPSVKAVTAVPLPVTVHAQVSRTAVWPGDPITYIVDVTCAPGTDILPEDLGRDRLRTQGLEVTGADLSRQVHSDGTTVHRATFAMATYSFDQTSLQIEPIRVRYFVRQGGQRIENANPAGVVEVPPVVIALRSTLPDSEPLGIRDTRGPTLLPTWVRLLRPVGLAAIVLSVAPVVFGAVAFAVRRLGTRTARRSRRHPKENQAALQEIRLLDGTSSATRLEAFSRLDGLVRDYLTDCDIPARSLALAEIRQRIGERYPQMPADAVESILHECHRALYGGAPQIPDAATLDRALDQTDALLASRVR